ncbi:unnamed protein product, partial [marine sediment metagenome]
PLPHILQQRGKITLEKYPQALIILIKEMITLFRQDSIDYTAMRICFQ